MNWHRGFGAQALNTNGRQAYSSIEVGQTVTQTGNPQGQKVGIRNQKTGEKLNK